MDIRPDAARWFEVVVPREDADDAMEALARRGTVQFEWSGDHSISPEADSLRASIDRYRRMRAEYSRYWPEPVFEKRCCVLPVAPSARAAVRRIERWRAAARPHLERLEVLEGALREIDDWEPVLRAFSGAAADLCALAHAGPALRGVCVLLPEGRAGDTAAMPLIVAVLQQERRVRGQSAILGVVSSEDANDLCEAARRLGGKCLSLPEWFQRDPEASLAQFPAHRAAATRELGGLERLVRASAQEAGLAQAVGKLERIAWFRDHAARMRCSGQCCWVSGWTSDADTEAMDHALREVGVRGSVSLPAPPVDAASPSVSRNPPWLEPFEVFTRAVGVPGLGEADPTTWVALLVPLLFGYMCGDVGHGLVILAAGLLMRRRTRFWSLLVLGGVSSMMFGVAYGDVFGYEHLIPPLWLRPMEEPLTLLFAPVVAGALVLSAGVVLHVVETCWQGQGGSEGVADAAQLLAYWGLLLILLEPGMGWLSVAGLLLCLANRFRVQRSLAALASGFGHFVMNTFELLLNTLSFARVGAFALAHAALESAVLALAAAAASTTAAILIVLIGNLIVIVVEGMIVTIQTTRLVFFEFFMRFFEGKGRSFHPAARPPALRG